MFIPLQSAASDTVAVTEASSVQPSMRRDRFSALLAFLLARLAARRSMLRTLDALPEADDLDILNAAKQLILEVKAPLAEVKSTQEAVLSQNADYLSRGALKQLEDRQKRELNARERSGIMEVLASARSLLRDVLGVLEGASDGIVNEDVAAIVERLAARTNTAGAVRAIDAVTRAERTVARNITPQLALEVMFLDIRKALLCR